MEAAAMEVIRRTFSGIRRNLGGLTATHKLLIGSIVIVLLMTLFVVSQYSGRTAVEELLPNAAATDVDAAEAHLATIGINTERRANKLMVGTADKRRAIASLAQARVLPNDKALLFETILKNPSWTNSRQQNEQLYNGALQNELAAQISEFRGVRAAKVLLDIPEMAGFGTQVRKPSASVAVTTTNGAPMDQGTVDAIAQFVAGSKAGLTIERVSIIDAANGRQRKATTDENSLPATYLEHAQRVEMLTREKVQDLLSYIPGVIVAVTAQVDVTRSKAEVRTNMPEKQGTLSLRRKETETTSASQQATRGAEAGFGANQTADINNGSSAAGNKTDTNATTTEYENHVGTRTETILDPKGYSTMVAVSVNVPRGFVASLAKPAAPASDADAAAANKDVKSVATEEEVAAKFILVKKDIIDSLTPHVRAMVAQANSAISAEELKQLIADSIDVAMIPIDLPAAVLGSGGVLGSLGAVMGAGPSMGGGGGLLSLGSGLIDKAVLGVLGIAALGMMMMMVKKAGKRTEMPTAEELVGLPPTLETEGDVVGEAEEGDVAMTGIEVDDAQMQSRKVLEQVSKLVQENTEASAKLLNRWITLEE